MQPVVFSGMEDQYSSAPKEQTAQQRCQPCAGKSQFGRAEQTEYQHRIAHNVKSVPCEKEPHRCARILNAVRELLVGVEEHLRQDAQDENQHIRAHQRNDFLG